MPEDVVKLVEEHHCFSFADDRDPACRDCVVFQLCMEERIALREESLPCFGEYLKTSIECQNCLEAGPCRAKRDEKE